jgi:UDP-N-acetylglucosamine diphosphorylase/glucosamine-1-phosphate N-acetyltransferase
MNLDSIILFDNEENDRFYPFSVLHPVWELRVGAKRLFEKYLSKYPDFNISFACANEDKLNSFLKRFNIKNTITPGAYNLILSSQLILDETLHYEIGKIVFENKNYLIKLQGQTVGIFTNEYINFNSIKCLDDADLRYEVYNLPDNIKYLNYIWDAISENSEAIKEDRYFFSDMSLADYSTYEGVYLVDKKNILISEKSKIKPNVVIDATNGPVIIDEDVTIMSGATILGPCYIGKNSTIKVGAKIYQDTSIGEVCKVGGEVESSIIQSYSNKQHDGFLGHSFLSEWVNLGADTNTSDLKNTYSEIKVIQKDEEISSGTMFLGLICGDHTKSAINTQFNTGTIAGVCGILVRPGFLSNHIKSFSWGGLHSSPVYKLNKAIEVCSIVMGRRDKKITEEEIKLLTSEHERVK